MRQLRIGLLIIFLLVDLAIAIYAAMFSNAAVKIRILVCIVMMVCGAYEIYDARTAIQGCQEDVE